MLPDFFSPGMILMMFLQPRFAHRVAWTVGFVLVLMLSGQESTVAVGQEKYSSFLDAYNTGVRFINSGNLAAARAPLEAAVKLAKTDRNKLDVHRALLVPYRELQEIEPMQQAAEYLISKSPQAAERSLTRQSLLSFIFKRGKMDAAIEGYEARLKKDPNDRTVLYLLTEAYGRYKQDPARSAQLGQKLAALEKKAGRGVDVYGQAQLAQQYAKAGKSKEAAELYESIAPLDKKLEAWHYKEAAVIWLKTKDKSKALAAAKKSDAAAPEARSALLTHFWHRHLGDVYLGVDDPKAAIPHYEQAIASTKIAGYVKDCQAKLAQARAAAGK